MQRPSSTKRANPSAVCVFIAGGLGGACQTPATHSASPESAPVVSAPGGDSTGSTLTATSVPETATSPQTEETSHAGWPNALHESTARPENTALAETTASKPFGASSITGCLSKPIASQNNPTRGPAASKPSTFRVTPLGNGALVTHEFGHACCLSATTETTKQDATITIRERLVGNPCRCVCDSSIQTRLNVPPGEYQVRLVLDTNGVESQVGTQPLTIKKLIGR